MVSVPQLARLHLTMDGLKKIARGRSLESTLDYLLAQHEKRVNRFVESAEDDYTHHRLPTVLPYWVSVGAYRRAHSGNPKQNIPVDVLNAPAVEAASVCHVLGIAVTWRVFEDEPLDMSIPLTVEGDSDSLESLFSSLT